MHQQDTRFFQATEEILSPNQHGVARYNSLSIVSAYRVMIHEYEVLPCNSKAVDH